MILCRTFAIANERVCRHYINKASPSASQTHQPTTAQRSVKADATRRNKIQAVLVRLGYSSIITNNRECPSSNGVPALRFQCSAEDRITKEVCALKSYFTRSCHHRCQHSLFYIPTVPDFTGYPTTQDLHFPPHLTLNHDETHPHARGDCHTDRQKTERLVAFAYR